MLAKKEKKDIQNMEQQQKDVMQFKSVKQEGKVSAGIKVKSVSVSLGHSEVE